MLLLLVCFGFVAGEVVDGAVDGAVQAQILELKELALNLQNGELLDREALKEAFSVVRQQSQQHGIIDFVENLRKEVCGPVKFLQENEVDSCRVPGLQACEGKWINATMTEQFWLVPCAVDNDSCVPRMQCSEVYAEWRDISDCSADCGLGIKRQIRNCLDRNGNVKNTGTCADVLERTVPCIAPCPGDEIKSEDEDASGPSSLVAPTQEQQLALKMEREQERSDRVLSQDLIGFYRSETDAGLFTVECAQGLVCNRSQRCSAPERKFAVRCCSDTERNGWVQNSGCPVWTLSKPKALVSGDGIACGSEYSMAEASAICHDNGGRLCTQQEVTAGCLADTTCGYDSELAWTSTICSDTIMRRLNTKQ